MLTKDEYVAESQSRLHGWNAEIAAMEAKEPDIEDDAKLQYRALLAGLREKRDEGERKLAELQSATESSWEHLKAGTESVWEALKDSARTFQSHFK